MDTNTLFKFIEEQNLEKLQDFIHDICKNRDFSHNYEHCCPSYKKCI